MFLISVLWTILKQYFSPDLKPDFAKKQKKKSISYYVSSTRYSVFEVLLITDSHRLEVFYCFLINTNTGYIPQLFEYTNKQFNLRD